MYVKEGGKVISPAHGDRWRKESAVPSFSLLSSSSCCTVPPAFTMWFVIEPDRYWIFEADTDIDIWEFKNPDN